MTINHLCLESTAASLSADVGEEVDWMSGDTLELLDVSNSFKNITLLNYTSYHMILQLYAVRLIKFKI